MCLQTVRRHLCRHCRTEWTAADILELCPEGDKCVLKHGYCAPVIQILENGGHHISMGCLVLPQPTAGSGIPGEVNRIYSPHQRNTSDAGFEEGKRILEDMCEDCKDKHYREWAIEARLRQEQQQQQQHQHPQHHHHQQAQVHQHPQIQHQAHQAQQQMNGVRG